MHAKISGIAVASVSLAAFCWRGSPLRPYTVTYWFRHSFYILYINHFVFYLLASLVAGFSTAWLVRRNTQTHRVA